MAKQYKRSGHYAQLHSEIIESASYRALKPVARALLVEFLNIHRPSRNGYLSISVQNAMKLLKASENTTMNAFDSLQTHGFIKLNKDYDFVNSLAREWIITFLPFNNREPTDDWKSWSQGNPVVDIPRKRNLKKPKNEVAIPMKRAS